MMALKVKELKKKKSRSVKYPSNTVWLYWEGECPAWILKCRETVFAHLDSPVQLVTPALFNKLRKRDRDIDLSGLCIAHRADFIRAFLLAEYGGIWLDSDCLLMKSLEPLFSLLNEFDFIGYRERSGQVTNNFMGARSKSTIAQEYYEKICSILRSGKELEWLTIGSYALTETIENNLEIWHELNVDQIQPICWSNPQAFFNLNNEQGHREIWNTDSYCYMISANMANGVVRENASKDLMHEHSFFNFLHSQAIEQSMLAKIAFRENTDDDRWIIPELIQEDMYKIKNLLSILAPVEKEYVIDCGAHIGAFSIMCAQYISNIDVIAFEPNLENYNYLLENSNQFKKIKPVNKAVSIAEGMMELYAPNQSDWTGRWSTLPNSNPSIAVAAIDLFSFIRNLDRPVFILKLDLAGYEEFILAHANKENFSTVNIVVIEVQSEDFDQERLVDFGYELLFRPLISSHRQFVFKKK